MKADDMKQKIKQFTDDLCANDTNCIVIVNPKDGGLEDAIELPEQADGLVQLLDGYKAKKKELDASIQWAENELKALMGDHETALAGERKITWKRQSGRITVDSKKLKADYPEIWEACKKEGNPTRVFKVAPKKEEK